MAVTVSEVKVGCFWFSMTGRSMNSLFHLRGNNWSPLSSIAEATMSFTKLMYVVIVCAERFAACIFATSVFTVPLLTLASGRSPILGLSHLSTQHCQFVTVAGFAGRRFRFTE